MSAIADLVAAHLDAWSSPAGPERDRWLATAYATDVYVGEPGAEYRGHEGMNAAISSLQAQAPGAAIIRTGPIQEAQGMVTYSWSLGLPAQPAQASGRDVLLVRDHTIVALYVVVDVPTPTLEKEKSDG